MSNYSAQPGSYSDSKIIFAVFFLISFLPHILGMVLTYIYKLIDAWKVVVWYWGMVSIIFVLFHIAPVEKDIYESFIALVMLIISMIITPQALFWWNLLAEIWKPTIVFETFLFCAFSHFIISLFFLLYITKRSIVVPKKIQ